MKKIFLLIILINITGLINAQVLQFDRLQQCINKPTKQIEDILLTGKYEFIKFDSAFKMISYKYSNTFSDREAGSYFCSFYKTKDTTTLIRYTTLDKQEYFQWLKYLKSNKYIETPTQYSETKKTEIFGLNKYGVMIETESADAIEIKMKVNKYTLSLLLIEVLD